MQRACTGHTGRSRNAGVPLPHLGHWWQQPQQQQPQQPAEPAHSGRVTQAPRVPSRWAALSAQLQSLHVQQLKHLQTLCVTARLSAGSFSSLPAAAAAGDTERSAADEPGEQPSADHSGGSAAGAAAMSVADPATAVSVPEEAEDSTEPSAAPAHAQQMFTYHGPLSTTLLRLKVGILEALQLCAKFVFVFVYKVATNSLSISGT